MLTPNYHDEPEEESRQRSEVTVRELWIKEGRKDYSWPEEPLDYAAIIQRIGPERWAELRARRDAILVELRKRLYDGGE